MSNEASYIAGQCTAWVAHLLGWIPAGLGDAKDWLVNAKAQGFSTGTTPSIGAVMVFTPSQNGVEAAGHVAVVQDIFSDGSIKVSEQNFLCGPFCTDNRVLDPRNAAIEGYIYPPSGASAGFTPTGTGWAMLVGSGKGFPLLIVFVVFLLAAGVYFFGVREAMA